MYRTFLSGNMDLPENFLWSSYEQPLQSDSPTTSEILSPGNFSPLSYFRDDSLVFDGLDLLNTGEIEFLPFDELEIQLHALEERSTSKNDSSKYMEISHAQNEDFQELRTSDFFRNKIENKNKLFEVNRCAKSLNPHDIEEESQDMEKSVFGEVMVINEPESLYSDEVFECKICLKKCETIGDLKEHYRTCYSEARAADETSISNLEERITMHIPDSASYIVPGVVLGGFVSENQTPSKTEPALMLKKSSVITGKAPAEDTANNFNILISKLSQNISISSTPVTAKAKLTQPLKKFYKCGICFDIFEHKKPLLCHLRAHATKSQKKCSTNLQPIKNPPGSKETFLCSFCGKFFYKKSCFIEHSRIHSGNKPYTCDVCLFSCSQSSNLNRHKKSHCSLLRRFTCVTCSRKFATKQELEAHNDRHEKNTAKISSQASSSSAVGEQIVVTDTKIHGESKDQNWGQVTSVPFTNLLETVRKSSSQTKDKAIFKCSVCSKEFAYKSLLKVHYSSHSKERNFQCMFCPKNYKYVNQLKVHINHNHGKDLPHCCTLCKKGFLGLTDLQLHMTKSHEQF